MKIIIVGGGAIGCSIAYHLAKQGAEAVVVDAGKIGGEASSVAAGILTVVTDKLVFDTLVPWSLQSLSLFPDFVREIEQASGIQTGYRTVPLMRLAGSAQEAENLRQSVSFFRLAGVPVEWLNSASAVNAVETGLRFSGYGALLAPEEAQITSSAYMQALHKAAARSGVKFMENHPVYGFEQKGARASGRGFSINFPPNEVAGSLSDDITGGAAPLVEQPPPSKARTTERDQAGVPVSGSAKEVQKLRKKFLPRPGLRIQGVRLGSGVLEADHVVVASGAWSKAVAKLCLADIPVEPVKGQIHLARVRGELLRHIVYLGSNYLCPRPNGEFLVGTTFERAGFSRGVNERASRELLVWACELLPALSHVEFKETTVNFRPATPDERPVLGPVPGLPGLWVASGHYRKGIILSPLTGKRMAEALLQGKLPEDIAPFKPDRFLNGS